MAETELEETWIHTVCNGKSQGKEDGLGGSARQVTIAGLGIPQEDRMELRNVGSCSLSVLQPSKFILKSHICV